MLAIGYVFEYSFESALIANSLENQCLNEHQYYFAMKYSPAWIKLDRNWTGNLIFGKTQNSNVITFEHNSFD